MGLPFRQPSSGARFNKQQFFTGRRLCPDRYSQHTRHHADLRQRRTVLVTAADKNFYQLLDIPKDADTKTIKRAFKKMALKYHPDVNKEPDAKDRFMACKTAYQTLADESERRRYDQTLNGGGGGFDWGSFAGGFGGQSSSSTSQQKKRPKTEEEEFYGFSQFFDDLEKEFSERQAKKTGQPRSLWQELNDIGEEFVEFLEQGVGTAEKSKKGASSQDRKSQGTADQAGQEAEANAQTAARDAEAKAEQAKKNADDEIEEMLAELKRNKKT